MMDYLVVLLYMKLGPLKTIAHCEAFKCAKHFEADNLGCMQPSFPKDGEVQQNSYNFGHSTAHF